MSEIAINGQGIAQVRKRTGELVAFDKTRITNAIFKAAVAVGGSDNRVASKLAEEVIWLLVKRFGEGYVPHVEEILDMIEYVLVENGHARTVRAFMLYRQKRTMIRNSRQFLAKMGSVVDGYLNRGDWRVKENSNADYSLSGLQCHISSSVMAEYTLENVYPFEVSNAHRNGDLHVHDLGMGTFGAYCAGWSLRKILAEGFNGVPGKISAKPAKHFNAALGQIVNFFGTLQNEWSGAQALSSFDTYLAPLVRKDHLDYTKVKQSMQEFIFAINSTSRWGNQVPFTNITLDWVVPEDLKDERATYGGKLLQETYSDYQDEMDLINKAFMEVMIQGDMVGRPFTFPIPTYNITREFDWDSDNAELLFKMTGKYGIPYFQNFVNSSLRPQDVRSMCCRLQLDLRELRSKTGGLFGSGEQTGSVGVVTINMARLGYLSKNEDEFFTRLDRLMYLAKESLEIKRKEVTKNMNNRLLPYTKRYLGTLDHHFATIGLNGMNECCLNFLGQDIGSKDGRNLALRTLDFFREKLSDYQENSSHIYNLEATPAEGVSYRLARIDKRKFPEIVTAGNGVPYYTNSTQLPVDYTDDMFAALELQDELQCKYTGGTVFHGFLGEEVSSTHACKALVQRVSSNFKLPYFTITPTFTICPVHGYIKGKHHKCPVIVS